MAEDLFQCQSLYAVLGLDDSATTDVIKARHKQLALKWHPDKWMTSSEEERHNAEEQFKMVLSDPVKRRLYDDGATHRSASASADAAQYADSETGPKLVLVSVWAKDGAVVRRVPWKEGLQEFKEPVLNLVQRKLGSVKTRWEILGGHVCMDIPASVYTSAFSTQPFLQVPLSLPGRTLHHVRIIAPPNSVMALATVCDQQPLPLMACPGIAKAIVAVRLATAACDPSHAASGAPSPDADPPPRRSRGPAECGPALPLLLLSSAYCYVTSIQDCGPVAFFTVDHVTHKVLFSSSVREVVVPVPAGTGAGPVQWGCLRSCDAAGAPLTEDIVVRCMLCEETGEDALGVVFPPRAPDGVAPSGAVAVPGQRRPSAAPAPPKKKVVTRVVMKRKREG